MVEPVRLLLVDNHDSFTFNLYQLLAEVAGCPPVVRTHDAPWSALPLDAVDGVVISPGPGHPARPGDFGLCRRLIEAWSGPLLGVCLGHQGLALAHGATVGPAPQVMHGRLSPVRHTGDDPLWGGIPQGLPVVRYHSLMVEPATLPGRLRPLAWADDGVLMALADRERPHWGVQFHPESICTAHGPTLLGNFVEQVRRHRAAPAAAPVLPRRSERSVGPATHRLELRPLDQVPDAEAAWLALFDGRRGAFWLDSALTERARFSYLGAAGLDGRILRAFGGRLELEGEPGEAQCTDRAGDVLQRLRAELATARLALDPAAPFPFRGGYVGYLGYEYRPPGDPTPTHPSRQPDACFVEARRLLVIDHHASAAWLAVVAPLAGPLPAADRGWLDDTDRRLAALEPPAPPRAPQPGAVFRPARSRARYLADIAACFEAIRAGESYEVCLTTHLETDAALDPVAWYRRLRRANPAPHAALLQLGETTVLSASPERFLRIEADGRVEARPIKGTRRRGANPADDAAHREALATAEKDRAENLMICDLLRNDLGRVCAIGSVHVPALMQVETYATVHQLVSTVRGQLRPGADAIDCVWAAFPGGSMTGAPKRRTMEIIARLEGEARGIYSGALGWFGLDGAADLSVVIRTAIVDRQGARVGVGGAIVALSDPETEFAEILLKGQALVDAAGGMIHLDSSVETALVGHQNAATQQEV